MFVVQAQLSALDDQFQTKLAAEAERYEELLRDKEALNERWDEQNKQLLLQHERLLEEVTADCDAKVQVRCCICTCQRCFPSRVWLALLLFSSVHVRLSSYYEFSSPHCPCPCVYLR